MSMPSNSVCSDGSRLLGSCVSRNTNDTGAFIQAEETLVLAELLLLELLQAPSKVTAPRPTPPRPATRSTSRLLRPPGLGRPAALISSESCIFFPSQIYFADAAAARPKMNP
jgi:hypothetical protein